MDPKFGDHSYSFICVVESWLSSEIDNSEISIQGYSVVRLDLTRHGGGLVIYVHNIITIFFFFSKGGLTLNYSRDLVGH